MYVEVSEINALSLDRARRRAPMEFLPAYDWFMVHEGADPIRRPTRQSGLAPDLSISLVAGMRGIHKPAGFDYALSVTDSGNSFYSDHVIEQDDGTWLFNYRAQEMNEGSTKTYDTYNEALRKCMRDGLPVGVLIKAEGSSSLYQCKGLAFVESYEKGVFTLHGPVREGQSQDFWSVVSGDDLSEDSRALLDGLDERDERVVKAVMQAQRVKQGRFREELLTAYDRKCAVSSCDVVPALQAAHISSYRGPKSQFASNGLLLRADLHLLYDAYLLSVDPDGFRVRLAPSLRDSQYREFNGARIRLPDDAGASPSPSRLAAHYERFSMNCVM